MAGLRHKIWIIAALLLMPSLAFAQSSRAKRTAATQKTQGDAVIVSRADEQPAAPLMTSHQELVKATETYKSSLRELLALREKGVAQAAEELEKLRALYKDGIISRRDFEKSEAALTELRGGVEEVRQKIRAADQMVAEALIEAQAAAAPPVQVMPRGSTVRSVAYIRYAGSGSWSLSEAAKIESFFYGQFGHHLPVSAFGQSDLHNRWGYDHRNAMDVALHPDSREGQALMAYLSSQRIPFLAFRQAVPGSATGPHIHVGKPSSKN
ncbi:MAG TPA: hypothetical protein VF544_10370 [Pyrinomonadaceae bacterium]|jgi:hypothetical protein